MLAARGVAAAPARSIFTASKVAAAAMPRTSTPRVAAPSPATPRGLATHAPSTHSFAKLSAEDITAFAKLLSSPSSSLLTTIAPSDSSCGVKPVGQDELDGYNADWMNKYKGRSQLVIKPKSTQEVADVVKYCYEKRIAVVPQGGNTGLVGGSVPVEDEVSVCARSSVVDSC